MKPFNLLISALITFMLSSCMGKSIDDPVEVLKFWQHQEFPEGTRIKKAHYSQSPHWTYEYDIQFALEFERGNAAFIESRQLVKRERFYLSIPSLTKWFPDPDKSAIYQSSLDDAFYIIPAGSNTIYVYDSHY